MVKTIKEVVKKLADGTLEYFKIGAQKLSDLENDTGFITNTVDNLTNYYTKEENYSKEEVNSLLGTVSSMKFEVIDTLPETGNTTTIYLMNSDNEDFVGSDWFDEYIYIEEHGWERIGSAHIDLANYITREEYEENKDTFILSAPQINYADFNPEDMQNLINAAIAGKSVEIIAGNDYGEIRSLTLGEVNGNSITMYAKPKTDSSGSSASEYNQEGLIIYFDDSYQFTHSINMTSGVQYLAPHVDYTVPYIPEYDGSPATKKYVDEAIASVGGNTESDTPTLFVIYESDSENTKKETTAKAWEAYQNNKNIMIVFDNGQQRFYYIPEDFQSNRWTLKWTKNGLNNGNSSSESYISSNDSIYEIKFDDEGQILTYEFKDDYFSGQEYLSTNVNYSEPYEPKYDGSPATKKYVDDTIANAISVGTKLEILESLDESQVGVEGIIYLVPNGDGTYIEYLYIAADSKWESIGSTAIDTSALGADWAENDENAATYVQNRTHYKYNETQTIFEENTYTASMFIVDYDDNGAIVEYNPGYIDHYDLGDLREVLPEGTKCSVTFNGEVFDTIVKADGSTLYLGNRTLWAELRNSSTSVEDTGEEFYFELSSYQSPLYARIPDGQEEVSMTFALGANLEKYLQLDPHYMANRIYNNLAVGNATAGENSFAVGASAVAGENAIASGNADATGMYSAAFGHTAEASGMYSFAAGNAEASGMEAIALGSGDATANYAVAIGQYVKASSKSQTAIGKNNIEDAADKYAFIIGNGTMSNTEYRSNAFTVDWDGNIWCEGTSIKIGGTSQDDTNAKEIATQEYVNEAISNISGGAGLTAEDMLPIEAID